MFAEEKLLDHSIKIVRLLRNQAAPLRTCEIFSQLIENYPELSGHLSQSYLAKELYRMAKASILHSDSRGYTLASKNTTVAAILQVCRLPRLNKLTDLDDLEELLIKQLSGITVTDEPLRPAQDR